MVANRGIHVAALLLGLTFVLTHDAGTHAQSPRCPAYPAFPDASCTGTLPGVSRGSSGSITTSFDGQVIQNLNINGTITVNHSNVTIRNVRITNSFGVAISNISCGSRCTFTLEDCELDGTGNPNAASAVDFTNFTMRRCNVHHFGEGPGGGNNTVIEDNYMHDFVDYVSMGAHQDGLQIEFGVGNVVRHNRITMNVDGGNAAIVVGNQAGNSNNLIEKNLVAGGGFAVYFGGVGTLSNNHFSTVIAPTSGHFGPLFLGIGASISRCGNRWHDGGSAGQLLSGESFCAGTPPPPSPPAAPTGLRIFTN